MPFLGKAGPPNHWKEMPTTAPFSLGINLNSCNYYSPEWLFVDSFKTCMPWITQLAAGGGDWDTGFAEQMPADADGYPLQVPFAVDGSEPSVVATLMCRSHPHFPSGVYTALFEGDGELSFAYSGATIIEDDSANGRYRVQVDFTSGSTSGVLLKIIRSDVNDHVRNIRFIMPGFENTYEEQIFHPLFLENIKDYSVIRFMDLQATNFGEAGTWTERTTPTHYTQGGVNGIAFEYQIELCNRLQIPGWFNVSHLAGKDYFDNLASLLQTTYDSSLDIWSEFSNEAIWNWIFPAPMSLREQGCADPDTHVFNVDGITCDTNQSGFRMQVKRSIQLFESLNAALGESRVKTVLGTQVASPWITEQLFNAFDDSALNPNGIQPDAVAGALYYGSVPTPDEIYANGGADTVTVDDILDYSAVSIRTQIAPMFAAQKALVDARTPPVQFVGYEGGNHVVAVAAVAKNHEALTEKLNEANRHPRMRDLNIEYLNIWFENGGGLFCWFSSVYEYSKYGSWGLQEYQDDLDAVKRQMMIEYIGADDVDTIRPTTPANFQIVNVTETTIETSWEASLDDTAVMGYKVFLNGSEVDTTLNTFYTYSGLVVGSTYELSVQAYDAESNYSLPSIISLPSTEPEISNFELKELVNALTIQVTDLGIQIASIDTDVITGLMTYVMENGETYAEFMRLIRAEAAGTIVVSGKENTIMSADGTFARITANPADKSGRLVTATDGS